MAALPTIKYALENGAYSIVLISHRGNPEGKYVSEHSLKFVSPELERQLGRPVDFLRSCCGDIIEKMVDFAPRGTIILLENLRFFCEEEGFRRDKDGHKIRAHRAEVGEFCESLAKLGHVYVNDAFRTTRLAHASMVGVKLPQRAAGLLMKKELETFAKVLENPDRPFLAVLGGKILSDKIQLIDNMLDKVSSE